jgi:hypothetical protein
MTTTRACGGFTFDHYAEILSLAQEQDYTFSTFSQHATAGQGRVIFMRHDIDLSLDNCLRFAHIENDAGVQSTYFVRVHARLYNPFEFHSYRKLREIESLGHELGLHYEPGFAMAVEEDEELMVRREKAVLEAVLDHPVVVSSAHLPGKSGMTVNEDNLQSFGLQIDAYSPRFMNECKYLSDSKGSWREGCLCQHLGSFERFAILTHGWWWFDRSPVENY